MGRKINRQHLGGPPATMCSGSTPVKHKQAETIASARLFRCCFYYADRVRRSLTGAGRSSPSNAREQLRAALRVSSRHLSIHDVCDQQLKVNATTLQKHYARKLFFHDMNTNKFRARLFPASYASAEQPPLEGPPRYFTAQRSGDLRKPRISRSPSPYYVLGALCAPNGHTMEIPTTVRTLTSSTISLVELHDKLLRISDLARLPKTPG